MTERVSATSPVTSQHPSVGKTPPCHLGRAPQKEPVSNGKSWARKDSGPRFPAYASQTSARYQGVSPDPLQLRVCWHFDLPLTAARLSLRSPHQQNQRHPNPGLSSHSLSARSRAYSLRGADLGRRHGPIICYQPALIRPRPETLGRGHRNPPPSECGPFDTLRHRR
jgi:hypothetical protein